MKKIISIIILLLSIVSMRGQDLNTVTATVVDTDNKPVAGACVRQQSNRSNYTYTDASGRFVLNTDAGQAVEISLNNGDNIVVVPKTDTPIVLDMRANVREYGFGIRRNLLESTAAISSVS